MAKEKQVRAPSMIEALIPIIVMMGLMIYCLNFDGFYVDAHMPLVISIAVACIVGCVCGHSFSDILAGMVERLSATLEAILILCTVGFLVSSFMAAGTIPTMVYYGLKLLSPKAFLPVGCIMCAIVGLACGSSWTATATVGLAFVGIGAGLGMNPAITAGMIISGAYVGDKFSPLSDTTNLAAGVSNTGLFDHVTAMVSTTGPTFLIALVLYTILGLNVDSSSYDPAVAQEICDAFAGSFNITPLVLIPLVVVILMCILRVPGLVGIAVSVATAILFSLIFQLDYVWTDGHTIGNVFDLLHYGMYTVETGNEVVDSILGKAHGMDGTMWTINLVLLAVAYGGALERCGSIERIFGGLKHKLNSVGSLVVATMATSIFCDATMCDQFLGIGVPAPLYVDKYDELGLGRNMLSRTLEDAGTLWSPMFPWTGCGAYQMGILGMSPFTYFPFAFVNLLNPIYAAITACLGRNIFWADGSYTNLFGKTKAGKPAGAPEEAHAYALKQLEERRAAGKAAKVG